MSINSIGFNNSLFGQAVQNLNSQLTNLSTQLATGEKSTTYSGMGINEGFAIAARSQLSNISAFTTTITNVNTSIGAANTALQSLSNISTAVQSDAASHAARSQQHRSDRSASRTRWPSCLRSWAFSTPRPATVSCSREARSTRRRLPTPASILNGSGTQAGLKQLIAERAQADGTTGLGRLVISSPTTAGAHDVILGCRRRRRIAVRTEAQLGHVEPDRARR